MFCTVVWKVAKGVLVEKNEKKQTATFKNIFVLFVYEYQSNISSNTKRKMYSRNI